MTLDDAVGEDRTGFPNLDSCSFIPRRYRPGNHRTWSGHLPFARDLVAALRPGVLVELGTHYGESYFGFCQSVVETGSSCACYAVDTWRGDPHSVQYGSEVYEEVERYNREWYGAFSNLLRTTFDDASLQFQDQSIDLLHIDGLHTYASVKHDWDTWFPKVAPGGIVLLHDIAARHADFGVWQLWEEVSLTYESFEFHHYFGLGVIRKRGFHGTHRGILDYLFAGRNAEAIRRYYALCSERLDARTDLAIAEQRGSIRPVYVDPPDRVIRALTGSDTPGAAEGEFFALPLDGLASSRTDWNPVDGRANTWRATTRDPGIICPAGFNASAMRLFVVVISCQCEEPQPHAQLFWSGKDRPYFNERHSIRFQVVADGRAHAYIVDLHAGADPGALNYLWWHQGPVEEVRFDPLDVPGEFTISVAGFAHQDRIEAEAMREALHLLPLRTELSYRYLRGSGIEIGALQQPLALRPDTHVRYVDRLTLTQAREQYPELGSLPLVNPSIISDAAALSPVAARSVDFVTANHVLEHLRDPLAALKEWLRVVRPGGHVYVAVPEHTNPLDRLRQVTELDHMIEDFKHREERSPFDRAHYTEWVSSTRPALPAEQRAQVESDLVSQMYAIHFHTFDAATFFGLLQVTAQYFPAEILEFRRTYGTSSNEFIAILRKF